MTIGNPSVFAIEYGITKAYERLSFRALGYFVIYVKGICYGVLEPDATMLACSFDGIQNRIARRSTHTAPFASELSAEKMVNAFRDALYSPDHEQKEYFCMPQAEFSSLFYSNKLIMAPDGDEAFDDGSYVLHIDFQNRVRLIAFKCREGHYYDPGSISDVWLESNEFYGILVQSRKEFEAEWETADKILISNDGAEGK